MKKISLALALGFTLALITGCANVVQNNDVARTLPNGVTLNSDEVAQLEGLAPEAESVQRSVIGNSDNVLSDSQIESLKTRFNDLLKEKFGSNWKKYTIVRQMVVDYNPETDQHTVIQAATEVDPETGVATGASSRVLNDGPQSDGIWIRHDAQAVWWPWYTVSQANSLAMTNGPFWPVETVVSRIATQVGDSRGTGSQIARNQASSSGFATGIGLSAFWPTKVPSFNVTTQMDYLYWFNLKSRTWTYTYSNL